MADELYDEIEDLDETERESERNQRAHIRELEKALKAERAERERVLAERETERAEARKVELAAQMKEAGLSERMADLYPADAPISDDAVAEWASSYGLAPQPKESKPQAEETLVDSYNRVLSQAWSTPASEDDLLARGMRGVKSALSKRTRPTQDELDEAEKYAQEVNALNRAYEREVQAGRAKPFGADGIAAYGGRVQPPPHANRTLEAQN